jgi:hypothetical protein
VSTLSTFRQKHAPFHREPFKELNASCQPINETSGMFASTINVTIVDADVGDDSGI